ncbi:phage tail tape measure protein [Devosia sp.]|uniref:phage tail tape measure protein n=1 Tax=Devosia sp. TaxID=1871048 RepID=UPI001B07F806|nr:phage tail tape measure protein [Devosia sp.]MBO9588283.1 phage tail tape measure protein [Devosia sp.]
MAGDLFDEDFKDELSDVSVEIKRIHSLADGVARSISSGFRSALTDGKSLESVIVGVGRAFADMALKAAFKPLETLAGNALEGLFAGLNPAIIPHAKGGVIATPTYFPLGGALGLAGEAGPEAIMPLARGPDGRLGVAGGGGGVHVTFNVTATDARSFAASEAEMSAMLLRAVRRGTRGS